MDFFLWLFDEREERVFEVSAVVELSFCWIPDPAARKYENARLVFSFEVGLDSFNILSIERIVIVTAACDKPFAFNFADRFLNRLSEISAKYNPMLWMKERRRPL